MLEWPGGPKNIRQVLIPRPETMTLFGKKQTHLCRCNQVMGLEMKRMFWIIQAGPKSSDGCPYTKQVERHWRQREDTDLGRWPCGERRPCSNAATSHRSPGPPEAGRGEGTLSWSLRRRAAWTPGSRDFWPPGRGEKVCCVKPPAPGSCWDTSVCPLGSSRMDATPRSHQAPRYLLFPASPGCVSPLMLPVTTNNSYFLH